jgi:hypothetical protein
MFVSALPLSIKVVFFSATLCFLYFLVLFLGNNGNARKNQNIFIFLLISKICIKKPFSKIIPIILCRLNLNKPVEHSDPTVPPNFEFPVYEAEDEEDDEEIPYEITRLLEQERRAIQPHQEEIELVNLGT